MADVIQVGFGSIAPTLLLAGAGELLTFYIPSPPGRIIRLRSVLPVALQTGGAFSALTYIPVMIAVANSSQIDTNKRPWTPTGVASGGIAGMWGASDATGFRKMFSALVPVQRQGTPIAFSQNDLVAQDGQMIVVVAGTLVDGSTSAPLANLTQAVGLTVLGDDILTSGPPPAQFAIGGNGELGVPRSIPKWDLSTSD